MKTQRSIQLITLILALIAVVFGIMYAARNTNPVVSNSGIRVVSAENTWGDIARQIGGSYATITSVMTDPNADPHLYESDATTASNVTKADVVIKNGLGYDSFIDQLLATSKKDSRTVLSAETVLAADSNANPHLWYDIARVSTVAKEIAAVFAIKDAVHATDFQNNARAFETALQPTIDAIQQIKQQYGGAPIAFTERLPEYLVAEAGLTNKTPVGFTQAIENGNDPSPSDINAMTQLISSKSINVLIYNSQVTSAITQHIKDLAIQANIPVVGMSETMPTTESTFQSWQYHQVEQLREALGK